MLASAADRSALRPSLRLTATHQQATHVHMQVHRLAWGATAAATPAGRRLLDRAVGHLQLDIQEEC